ncbi:hypothetical protein QUF54_06600 [Candidatus Marithioploca araucensis]|uniref:Copper resistance protein D domain-containing protein n=1 Tax=Candidatus Marithioploca araucensis TaxID=70273 RepID=A0ABT7VTV3_9GAMM|nr:hypothetical protein [Candidatus Marithioploca araucensis]
MGNTAITIHIMLTLGLVMTVLFMYIVFVPFVALKQAISQKDFKSAGGYLATIRKIIVTNLWLGMITIVVATAGRYILIYLE